MRYRHFALGFFVLLLCIFCRVELLPDTDKDAPPFDIDSWLQGPERKDFSCKIKIYKPVLTFQQRQLVRIQTVIDPGSLDSDSHRYDFHVVIKVAPDDKDWSPGYSYTHIPFVANTVGAEKIESFNGFYLKPGRYTFAILVYDAIHMKGNNLRKKQDVPRLKGVPLPDLNRDLPEIEYVVGVPRSQMTVDTGYILEPGWPMSRGRERLPVENDRCLCIDVIAFTANDYYYQRPYAYGSYSGSSDPQRMKHPVETAHILEMASVLSHLSPHKGQVRVSILSMDRMKTVFYREKASVFDWRRASDLIAEMDTDTINIDRIKLGQTSYLSKVLRKIIKEEDCASEADQPVKIAIIVARNPIFDDRAANLDDLVSNTTDMLHIFNFWPSNQYSRDEVTVISDQIKSRRFVFYKPKDFRKNLASLISDLEEY